MSSDYLAKRDRHQGDITRITVHPESRTQEIGRLHHLDGLRGIAALCVAVFAHYVHFIQPYAKFASAAESPFYDILWPLYVWGERAVDVFFVVSGITFAHVYGRVLPSAGSFAWRRVARLYPVHLLTLLATALLIAWFHALHGRYPVYTSNGLGDFVANLAFMQFGIWTMEFTFNGPAWSLSVEAMMYVGFYLLVRWRLTDHLAPLVFLGSAAFLFVGLGWHEWPILNDQVARGALGFFGGVILYRHPQASAALPVMALLLYLAGGPPVLGAYAIILAAMWAVAHLRLLRAPFEHPAMLWLGDRCLSIYLVHFPVQVAIMLAIGDQVPYRDPLFLLAYAATVLVVADLTWRWFERPAQRALLRLPHRRGVQRALAR